LNIKWLAGAVALVAWVLAPAGASAAVTFNWVCDNAATCSANAGEFGGYITFADSAVAPGATFTDATDKVLSFYFKATIPLGFPLADTDWVVSDAQDPPNEWAWTFNASATELVMFEGSLPPPGATESDTVAFLNSGGHYLEVVTQAALGENMVTVLELDAETSPSLSITGKWLRAPEIPVPGSWLLFGSALAALRLVGNSRVVRNRTEGEDHA
jgi:hypothetical protein